ncbi:MAG: glycosyltransferase [Oscillochloris sp.]|nr:glycosyltransferase [Oscillochloris sp.]
MPIAPVISIVLPVHNAAPTLPACLASIARQSCADYELIVVDDGSTDQSAALLAEHARADPRIRLLRPGRVGLADALNIGIGASQAPLIARMDADDLMHPQRLAFQAALLADQPEWALVAARVAAFPRHLVRDGYREYLRWQNSVLTPEQVAAEIYIEAPFAHPSVIFRREAVTAIGGYRNGNFPEDYELWLRMHNAGMPMAKHPRVLLAWRERPDRTSRRDPRYAREQFDALRAAFLARDPRLHQERPLVYWGAGRPTRLRARRLIEQGFPPTAWIDVDPRKIGQKIAAVPVYPPTWLQQTPRPFVLVYLTAHGARDDARSDLHAWGYRPGADYLAVG